MSDHTQGAVVDAGQTVQRGLNQAGEARDQLSGFICDYPICAALIAVGVGYLLGKIT